MGGATVFENGDKFVYPIFRNMGVLVLSSH